MNRRSLYWLWLLSCLTTLNAGAGEPFDYDAGGHLKSRGTVQTYPDDSVFNPLTGSSATDLNMELRLLFSSDNGPWDFNTDGQLIILYGDTVEYTRELVEQVPGYELLFGRLINDNRRWWDLTHTVEDESRRAVIARLDRLSVGYTDNDVSVRLGRQAITWSNGLIFTPMDIVNPFDPTQIDTEYKAGDDMLYGQFLRRNGHDIQAAYVVRRNPVSGDVASDQVTLAAKYHGFADDFEFDVMAAYHYDEAVLAVGGSRDIGGAVWRGDLVLSDTRDEGVVTQFVINASYSWVWDDNNVSGSAEYFFNGFGQHDGCYSPDCLADNPDLIDHMARRQLFTLGRHYLGGNLAIEMTPLFNFTTNLFWNLGDDSALLQLVTQNSLDDNLTLLGALAVPLGNKGTEYGGLETGIPGVYFSSKLSLLLQLGWYF
ncbi:MAG: hypothetical protein GY792_33420 [Gammaproteobacteria bacterium]|nr:hypothetical protein [Gammaproteobacteria bacterium]